MPSVTPPAPRNPNMVRAQVHAVCALLCVGMAMPMVACKTQAADTTPDAAPVASVAPPPPPVTAADPVPSAPPTATETAAATAPPPEQQVAMATPPPAPPPPVEPPRPPAPPGFDYFVPGFYRWDGHRYLWERGHWDHRHGRAL